MASLLHATSRVQIPRGFVLQPDAAEIAADTARFVPVIAKVNNFIEPSLPQRRGIVRPIDAFTGNNIAARRKH